MGEEELVGERAVGAAEMAAPADARFLGGPLDGRRYPFLGGEPPAEGHVVTHVYLHGGPKIESQYRLGRDETGTLTYYLVD